MKLLLYLFAVLTISSNAQTTFTKYFTEQLSGPCLTTTSNNGFMIGGWLNNNTNYIAKFDSAGNVIWEKVFGTPSTLVKKILQIDDSSYIVACVDTLRIYLFIINDLGDTSGFNCISFNEQPDISTVIKTLDGGILITGSFTDTINQSKKMLILKMNLFGAIEWSSNLKANLALSTFFNVATSAIQLSDSNFYITGFFKDTSYFEEIGCLIKISKNGNVLWSKKYNSSAGSWDYTVLDIFYIEDSLTIFIGVKSPVFGNGFFIVRTDTSGNFGTSKLYIDPMICPGYGCKRYQIKLDSDSNFIVLTTEPNSTWKLGGLLKIDYSGNTLWIKSTIVASELLVLNDNGILILGSSFETGIMKGDSEGNGINCWFDRLNHQATTYLMIQDTVAFNVSNDGILCTSSIPFSTTTIPYLQGCITANVNEINETTAFSIYPNPANNNLTIILKNIQEEITVCITDMFGKNIKSFTSNNKSEFTVDVSNLSSGIYNIVVQNSFSTNSSRFIKINN
jgi:hypothetical protein